MKNKLNCVLLIDDDEPTNYFNSFILDQAGCTNHVQAVQSGQEALEYLTNKYLRENENDFPFPDLIFLDINMPAMNGWEFLEKYRKLEKKHKGKIILVMLTTSLFPDDIVRAGSMPEISGFENKTLTPETLDRIMQKFFPDNN